MSLQASSTRIFSLTKLLYVAHMKMPNRTSRPITPSKTINAIVIVSFLLFGYSFIIANCVAFASDWGNSTINLGLVASTNAATLYPSGYVHEKTTLPEWFSLLYHAWCARRESNPHGFWPRDFKSLASTSSATRACNRTSGIAAMCLLVLYYVYEANCTYSRRIIF